MRCRALATAALLLSACAAPGAGAHSPALADPQSLAGAWTLTLPSATCRIVLTATASAHGYRAAPRGACPAPIAQWRPVPDGLELAGADGLTLILFEPVGPGAFEGRDADRRRARLTR